MCGFGLFFRFVHTSSLLLLANLGNLGRPFSKLPMTDPVDLVFILQFRYLARLVCIYTKTCQAEHLSNNMFSRLQVHLPKGNCKQCRRLGSDGLKIHYFISFLRITSQRAVDCTKHQTFGFQKISNTTVKQVEMEARWQLYTWPRC